MKVVMMSENGKKSFLVNKYKSFKMKSHETIDKMYYKYNDIIKGLETLGKEYSLGEKNKKYTQYTIKEVGDKNHYY